MRTSIPLRAIDKAQSRSSAVSSLGTEQLPVKGAVTCRLRSVVTASFARYHPLNRLSELILMRDMKGLAVENEKPFFI